MFKDRAVQVTLVKTNKSDTTDPIVESPFMTPEEINTFLQENVKRITVHVVAAVAAGFLMRAACDIVVDKLTK